MNQQMMPPVTKVDFAIIGGGIAGSSLAIVLQRSGWSTIVIEREPVFRDRVRGEACHPWGVRELDSLGLRSFIEEIGAVDLPNWTRYRDGEIDTAFAWSDLIAGSPPEIGFSHPDLQEALLNGASNEGAMTFRPARAAIARQDDEWLLHVVGEDKEFDVSAKFLVAADGRNSSTRKLWGGETRTDIAHHSFGGMLVSGLNLDPASAHQGYHDAGFSMIFPQGKDRWRVYYVCPTERAREFSGENREADYLAACAACFPDGAFANARQIGPLAFFPNPHIGATVIHGDHAVAIGDAAGAGDPSQGHGMSLVWRDVRELRDLLSTEDWKEVPALFAIKRRAYEHVLRTHAAWVGPLTTDTDADAMALQEQVEGARADDPSALGYAAIFVNGPDNLPTDDESRARFFGEYLHESPVRIATPLDKLA